MDGDHPLDRRIGRPLLPSRRRGTTGCMKVSQVVGGAALAVGVVAARDLTQKKHAIRRNFPVIGHVRYLLETIGPELRQYIVDEQRRGAALQP